MFKSRWLHRFFYHSIFLLLLAIAHTFKISYLVGSQNAYVSGSALLFQLSGWYGGSGLALTFFSLRWLFSGLHPLIYILRRTPGLFGAFYWSNKSKYIRLALPLSCIILFIVHPIGRQAYLYSFYWFIPIFIHLFKKDNLFSNALGSTFTTHAVGSVIWLYTTPMPASQWLALIPVVAIERSLFVGMMTIVIGTIEQLSKLKPLSSIAKKVRYVFDSGTKTSL